MSKVLVIVSTSEYSKALLGVLWATATLKEKCASDVELVFFGPIEEKIAEGDEKLLEAIDDFKKLGKKPIACERVARANNYLDKLADKIDVGPVGELIGEYIGKGYVPLVF